ncbi:Bug family tripartite tricarboxylate transporter substrate binding protein [Siccirubricoccus deserti]
MELLHVPYRGSGAVYPDLIAQRISILLDVMGSSAPQAAAGAVRPIGITAKQRAAAFPEVPTIAEQGIAGYEFLTWFGFFARSGTPEPARARLEAAIHHAVATPEVQERLAQASAVPLPADGAGFGAWFAAEVARWRAWSRPAAWRSSVRMDRHAASPDPRRAHCPSCTGSARASGLLRRQIGEADQVPP